MKIISCQPVNLIQYGYNAHPCVWQLHVRIDHADFPAEGLAMITQLQEDSWLNNFDILDQLSFRATIEPTLALLTKQILEESEDSTLDDVKKDFGEYLVSVNAQQALVQCGHTPIPLPELWKEKKKGNPGFDFHTISPNTLFVYGEAKYAADNSSNSRAIRQIADFLNERKHTIELKTLRYITRNEEAAAKAGTEQIGIAAAFSVKQASVQNMINNAISNTRFKDLLNRPEIYVIAVEII